MKDIAVILIAGIAFAIIYSFFGSINFNKDIATFMRALGAGVSEEIIFRLFIYSLILHITGGEASPGILTYLLLSLPFAMLHFVDLAIAQGWLINIPNLLSLMILTTPMVIAALKRDIFAAIGIHFMFDLILIK